jgi:hypothetical protein
MDDHLLRLFQMQIWTQCRFALLALDDFRAQLADADAARERAKPKYENLLELSHEQMRAAATEISMDWAVRTWYPVQAFLSAVANISKALWGQGGSLTTQRADLRASLGIQDDSPLRSTAMRNHFDHFDDRLDKWWKRSTNRNYVDLSFGDMASAITGPSIEIKDMFRSYDPATNNLVFWGETYHIPTIEQEIARIMPLALIATSTFPDPPAHR